MFRRAAGRPIRCRETPHVALRTAARNSGGGASPFGGRFATCRQSRIPSSVDAIPKGKRRALVPGKPFHTFPGIAFSRAARHPSACRHCRRCAWPAPRNPRRSVSSRPAG
ncbi:MAG: hypothetical protein EOS71_13775 [Mesorhizobium sp.]|nr:MAG: hypothetical protein EOS71_13775 [Mesorhizobium sp.]